MSFTDIFIRRPVFATVLSLIVLLVGLRSYFTLPVRQYPRIDASVVTVTVNYAGADASLMEGFVTTPIENALGGTDGVDYIISSSTLGQTTITLYFKLGYDINAAASDVNAKVTSVRYMLPKDINDPVIAKTDPNAQPSMYLSFLSPSLPNEKVTDFLKRSIQPQIQTFPGVGTAQVWGSEYAMRIWLNQYLMSAYNITPNDIQNALYTQSLQSPGGQLKTSLQELTVKTFSEAETTQQFDNLVIHQRHGQIIKIKDIGKSSFSTKNNDVSVWINGKVGTVVAVTPSSIANPLDVSAEVRKAFPNLLAGLPKSVEAEILWDSSKFIEGSINEVKKTVIEATLCVIIVVFLFLGSWRTLLIPVVTIPLSLVGVCTIMLALGYSINTITLLAMVLAIGMVVDDAIVVAENIYRHISGGKTPLDASLAGAKEIQFAIIAMTLTLAAVYAPIGFLTGLIGALFKEFAFTLAGSVIISGFVAITLSPMMCSKIMLPHDADKSVLTEKIDAIFGKVMQHYETLLLKVLKNRNKILCIIPIVLTLSALMFTSIPSELAPEEDSGHLYIPLLGPTSANINYTQKYSRIVESLMAEIPETQDYLVINGGGQGTTATNIGLAVLILKPWEKRTRTVEQIIEEIFPKFWAIPGIIAFPMNPPDLPGAGSGSAIQIEIQTLGDYTKLNQIAKKIVEESHKNPKLFNVRVEPRLDQPQLNVNISRDKAGTLGVSASDIGTAINISLGQPNNSWYFELNGRSYCVIPQLFPETSIKPSNVENLYLRTARGSSVPLKNITTLTETVTPQSYNHFQQLRSMEITASMVPGYSLNQALQYFQKIIKEIAPSDITIDYAGQARLFFQTGSQMAVTFIFAIIFIFLVLAAQFESFRDPFIVLFTIPLSVFGALLAMILTGCTMNIYSEIGLVTLVGLISKHGILMVEFANQLQETGKNIEEAIIKSAITRLRPILMTTAAMVLGTIPLALATGAGANSRQQIGWVIIGGMSVGTIFTLFVVPVIYTILATKKQKCSIKI